MCLQQCSKHAQGPACWRKRMTHLCCTIQGCEVLSLTEVRHRAFMSYRGESRVYTEPDRRPYLDTFCSVYPMALRFPLLWSLVKAGHTMTERVTLLQQGRSAPQPNIISKGECASNTSTLQLRLQSLVCNVLWSWHRPLRAELKSFVNACWSLRPLRRRRRGNGGVFVSLSLKKKKEKPGSQQISSKPADSVDRATERHDGERLKSFTMRQTWGLTAQHLHKLYLALGLRMLVCVKDRENNSWGGRLGHGSTITLQHEACCYHTNTTSPQTSGSTSSRGKSASLSCFQKLSASV